MKVDLSFIPDSNSGDWSVESFEVKRNDLSQRITLIKTGRSVTEGTYKRLKRCNTVVMSNTPDEIRDFTHFTRKASGSILINGLGLGCVIKVLLEKPDVTKITVIEQSKDVISLISPYFTDSRLTIINADAFEYKPLKGEVFDYVWHDIWDYICGDNLSEMATLHRKYARKTNWQDSWAKSECKRLMKREKSFF